MTTKYDLDMLDRATLLMWRAWNTIKWSIAALAVAFAVAAAFFAVMPSFRINLSTRKGILEATLLMLIPTILGAIGIGAIIGRHVLRRPFLTAGIVAIVHMVLSIWTALHGIALSAPAGFYFVYTPTGEFPAGEQTLMLLVLVVQVYIAGTMASRAWLKRPRALRGQP